MLLSELLASLLTSPPAGTMIWIRYTNSPLLTTITALSCQPVQESTRLDPPLSLQRPQRPQHRTPLSTLQSTHQTHILIQSKQHLQPSSHVPTPRAPRVEEGIATCHKIDRLAGVGVLVGRMGRATAGSRANISGRAKSTSTRGA